MTLALSDYREKKAILVLLGLPANKDRREKKVILGPTGPTGPLPAVTVGKVVSGTDANVISNPNAAGVSLDFTLPIGPTGPTGPIGAIGVTGPTGPGPIVTIKENTPVSYKLSVHQQRTDHYDAKPISYLYNLCLKYVCY